MPYSTEAEFNALGLPAIALDGVTDTTEWRTAAAGKIDSYLRGRYRLPLVAPYPPEIVEVEAALAGYSFISIRGFDPTEGANANVLLRYKDAMNWLRLLSEGKVNLAWAPRKPPTGTWPLLEKTGKMRRGFKVVATSAQLQIHNSQEYLKYHQNGTAKMQARPVLPGSGLTPSWQEYIDVSVASALEKALT